MYGSRNTSIQSPVPRSELIRRPTALILERYQELLEQPGERSLLLGRKAAEQPPLVVQVRRRRGVDELTSPRGQPHAPAAPVAWIGGPGDETR